jgi:UDPglucose 6-dehydrogenase
LNEKRFKWALRKIKTHIKTKNPTTCIWGLSYKKNTTSTHNAASIEIIKSLKNKARFKVYDPMAILPKKVKGYSRFKDKYEALRGADCLLVLTDWDEFAKIDVPTVKKLMRHNLIIDSVGIFRKKKDQLNDFTCLEMGVRYHEG